MAIQFILEDGTGLSNSTTYGDVSEYRQYWENRGIDYYPVPLETIQGLLNRGTQFMDNRYSFQGDVISDDQSLEFPRNCIYDNNNNKIADNIVPIQVKNALFEIGKSLYLADLKNKEITDANASGKGIKSQRLGPMSITYSGSANGIGTQGIRYPEAESYLHSLIDRGVRV